MMSLSHLQSVLLCLVALSLFCLSLAVPPPFIQNRFRKSQPRKIFVYGNLAGKSKIGVFLVRERAGILKLDGVEYILSCLILQKKN